MFYASEYQLLMEQKKQNKKRSKEIYKEFRNILDKDKTPLIVGTYGVDGKVIKEDKIQYKAGQDEE